MKKKNYFNYVVTFAVLLIPFMYGFFYLKAYWNPYGKGHMDNIPVAIVNNDKGTKGKDLTKSLIDSKKLKFEVTNQKEGEKGLYNKKYYALITIPSDFTSNLESAKKENKVPATVTYSPNQKSNYLASQIISRVLVVAEENVRDNVSSEVVKTLSNNLKEVPNKMNELNNGAKKLNEGAKELNEGANELNNKYTLFDNGITKLENGSDKLTSGANELNNGISSLNNGATLVNSGVKQINSALNNVDLSKLNNLNAGVNSLNDGASNLQTGLNIM